MQKTPQQDNKKKVAPSPTLVEYKSMHSKDVHQSSLKRTLFETAMFIFMIVLILTLCNKLELFKLAHINTSILAILYTIFVISLIYTFKMFFFHSLRFSSILIKLIYPEIIFIPSFLKSFSKHISNILAFSSTSYYISFSEFVSKINERQEIAFFKFSDLFSSQMPINMKHIEEVSIDKTSTANIIMYSIIPLMIKFYLIFVIRDLTTFSLNYLIHSKFYYKRITENIKKITLLRNMNDLAGLGYNVDLEEAASAVFRTISKDGKQSIVLEDLQKYFNSSVAEEIFNLCKNEEHNDISEDELHAFYYTTIRDQEHLEKSIFLNNASVESFEGVLNVFGFCIILVIFINYLVIFKSEEYSFLKGPSYFLATVISANYIFSESFKGFCNSLYYVFFVRPCEVGDLIALGDVVYEVFEINMLTTVLFNGSTYCIWPNSKISGENIRNMRLNRTYDIKFTYKFLLDQFENNKDAFVKKVHELQREKPSEYKKKAYFDRINMLGSNKVEVDFVVQFSAERIEILRNRRNALFFKLNTLLLSSGITPIKD